MERLTYRDKDGMAMMKERGGWKSGGIDRLAAYEDSGLEPEDIKKHEAAYNECLTRTYGPFKQKIIQWIRAEQDGLLVVLPCKAGDHVWIDGRDAIVTEFFGYRSERYFHAVILGRNKHIDIPFDEIGKTVFLTREEAEAALAQEGGTHEADSV